MVGAGRWLARIVLGITLPFVAANALEPPRSAVGARSPLRGEVVVAADDGIFVLDARARTLRRLTRGDDDLAPSWSPDGRRLAYADARGSDPAAGLAIELIDPNSPRRARRRLAPGAVGPIRWSPDGSRLAFLARNDALEIVRLDGRGRRRLVHEAA